MRHGGHGGKKRIGGAVQAAVRAKDESNLEGSIKRQSLV